MPEHSAPQEAGSRRHRTRARVALALLEEIRDHDLPPEVFEDENVSLTMPRRLGLSSVIETQIRRYSEDSRRGRKIPDAEVHDLIRLVVRRPDAEDLFYSAGEALYEATGRASPYRWFVPRTLKLRLARREVQRRLRGLFGRPVVRESDGGLALDAELSIFIDGDPGGDACQIVTGFASAGLSTCLGEPVEVRHVLCRGLGDPLCRWELEAAPGSGAPETARPADAAVHAARSHEDDRDERERGGSKR